MTDFDQRPGEDLDRELSGAFRQVTTALQTRPAPHPLEVRMLGNRRHRNRMIAFGASTVLSVVALGGVGFAIADLVASPDRDSRPATTGAPDPTGTPPATTPPSNGPSKAPSKAPSKTPDTRDRTVDTGTRSPGGRQPADRGIRIGPASLLRPADLPVPAAGAQPWQVWPDEVENNLGRDRCSPFALGVPERVESEFRYFNALVGDGGVGAGELVVEYRDQATARRGYDAALARLRNCPSTAGAHETIRMLGDSPVAGAGDEARYLRVEKAYPGEDDGLRDYQYGVARVRNVVVFVVISEGRVTLRAGLAPDMLRTAVDRVG